MQIPLEISYRGIEKSRALDSLIHEQAGKLEQVCDHVTSVRVSVEKINEHQQRGQPYRVRVIARVPPGHELVAASEPTKGDLHIPIDKEIRDTFHALGRQVKEVNQRQKGAVKMHPQTSESTGIIERVLKEEGYGFIRSPEGEEIYFHRNSVLHRNFDRLAEGTGVRYVRETGEKGPQASTVDIVDKPGERIAAG